MACLASRRNCSAHARPLLRPDPLSPVIQLFPQFRAWGPGSCAIFARRDPFMSTLHNLVKDRRVYSIDGSRSVLEAARYMMEHNIGAVAVLREAQLAGILSERDIMNRVVAVGRTPGTTAAAEVMTPNPPSMRASKSVSSSCVSSDSVICPSSMVRS
jgi:CBS domain